MEGVQVGQLVRASAGRDKGRFYLIYELLDEAFVRVIDGDKKKITNPKRKNIKHLEIFPVRADNVAEKLVNGKSVTEKEISESIKTLGLSHID